jgi:hypothetical protein
VAHLEDSPAFPAHEHEAVVGSIRVVLGNDALPHFVRASELVVSIESKVVTFVQIYHQKKGLDVENLLHRGSDIIDFLLSRVHFLLDLLQWSRMAIAAIDHEAALELDPFLVGHLVDLSCSFESCADSTWALNVGLKRRPERAITALVDAQPIGYRA